MMIYPLTLVNQKEKNMSSTTAGTTEFEDSQLEQQNHHNSVMRHIAYMRAADQRADAERMYRLEQAEAIDRLRILSDSQRRIESQMKAEQAAQTEHARQLVALKTKEVADQRERHAREMAIVEKSKGDLLALKTRHNAEMKALQQAQGHRQRRDQALSRHSAERLRLRSFRLEEAYRARLKQDEKLDSIRSKAKSAMRAGRMIQALKYYDIAVSELALPANYHNRGMAYYELGMLMEGIADLKVSIDADPNDYLSFLYRGICRAKLGLKQLAKNDFQAATILDPDDLLLRLWLMYVEGQYSDLMRMIALPIPEKISIEILEVGLLASLEINLKDKIAFYSGEMIKQIEKQSRPVFHRLDFALYWNFAVTGKFPPKLVEIEPVTLYSMAQGKSSVVHLVDVLLEKNASGLALNPFLASSVVRFNAATDEEALSSFIPYIEPLGDDAVLEFCHLHPTLKRFAKKLPSTFLMPKGPSVSDVEESFHAGAGVVSGSAPRKFPCALLWLALVDLKSDETLLAQGALWQRLGRHKQMLAAWQKAVEKGNKDAAKNLGDYYFSIGKFWQSVQFYKIAGEGEKYDQALVNILEHKVNYNRLLNRDEVEAMSGAVGTFLSGPKTQLVISPMLDVTGMTSSLSDMFAELTSTLSQPPSLVKIFAPSFNSDHYCLVEVQIDRVADGAKISVIDHDPFTNLAPEFLRQIADKMETELLAVIPRLFVEKVVRESAYAKRVALLPRIWSGELMVDDLRALVQGKIPEREQLTEELAIESRISMAQKGQLALETAHLSDYVTTHVGDPNNIIVSCYNQLHALAKSRVGTETVTCDEINRVIRGLTPRLVDELKLFSLKQLTEHTPVQLLELSAVYDALGNEEQKNSWRLSYLKTQAETAENLIEQADLLIALKRSPGVEFWGKVEQLRHISAARPLYFYYSATTEHVKTTQYLVRSFALMEDSEIKLRECFKKLKPIIATCPVIVFREVFNSAAIPLELRANWLRELVKMNLKEEVYTYLGDTVLPWIIQHYRSDPYFYAIYGIYLEIKKIEPVSAITQYQAAVSNGHDAEYVWCRYRLMQLLYVQSRYDEYITHALQFIVLTNTPIAGGIEKWGVELSIDSARKVTISQLIKSFYLRGSLERAQAWLKVNLNWLIESKMYPFNSKSIAHLQVLLALLGDVPESMSIRQVVGRALFEAGRYSEAQTELRQYVRFIETTKEVSDRTKKVYQYLELLLNGKGEKTARSLLAWIAVYGLDGGPRDLVRAGPLLVPLSIISNDYPYFAQALYLIGWQTYHGKGLLRNFSIAKDKLEVAVRFLQGHHKANAHFILARVYYLGGDGVKPNYKKALSHYEAAKAAGHVNAAEQLKRPAMSNSFMFAFGETEAVKCEGDCLGCS